MQLTELRGEYEAKLKYIEQIEEENKSLENTIIDKDQMVEDLKIQIEESKKETSKLIENINIRINENEKYLDSVEEEDIEFQRKSRNNSNENENDLFRNDAKSMFDPMSLFNKRSESEIVLDRLSKSFEREKRMYNNLNIELQNRIRDISTLVYIILII